MKTNRPARRKRRSAGGLIIAVIAVFVVLGLVNSGRSFMQILHLSKTKTEERKAADNLARTKTRMEIEIYRLLSDSLYIEEIARKEYGMVKRGEEVFSISPPDTTDLPARAGTPEKKAHVP